MPHQSPAATASKDRFFMQSLAILYFLADVFLVVWLFQTDTAFGRVASGFSILGISVLLLQTVDGLRADIAPGGRAVPSENASHSKRMMLVTLGFALWLGLYYVGCSIGAYRYIQAVQQPGIGPVAMFWNAMVIACAYTYSNVGMLCIITAFLGGLGRKMAQAQSSGRIREEVLQGLIPKAILRSVVIAGVVIAAALALGSPTTFLNPDPYISFALLMSAVGLINGYMPQWFYHEA